MYRLSYCVWGWYFLGLEPVYFKYLYKIDGQTRKNIAKMVLDQIAQCVLTDIIDAPKRTENEKRIPED
jgi:DNA-binding protein Fis